MVVFSTEVYPKGYKIDYEDYKKYQLQDESKLTVDAQVYKEMTMTLMERVSPESHLSSINQRIISK